MIVQDVRYSSLWELYMFLGVIFMCVANTQEYREVLTCYSCYHPK